DGARGQQLAGTTERGDASADVHGDAGEVVTDRLALAGVDPGSDRDSGVGELLDQRPSAADRTGRAVEGGEKAITGRADLAAAEAHELRAHEPVVMLEHLPPAPVTERRCLLGRGDNVGEKHG